MNNTSSPVISSQIGKLKCYTIIFCVTFTMRAVYGCFLGFYYKIIPDFYTRFMVSCALDIIWDLPLIVSFLFIDY